MNHLEGIGSLAGWAVSGVVGYVLAQFVGKPIFAYWELKKDIARCLVFYANADSTLRGEDPVAVEARRKFRDLASSLVGIVNSIPLYNVWARLGAVPSQEDMNLARANLIGLSNAVGIPGEQMNNSRRYENIEKALRIVGSR